MDKGPIRILLIDDDEDEYISMRDLLAEIQENQFHLDWLSDAGRALEEMCGHTYALFLIDYKVGRADGLALLRKAIERGCTAPIIVLAEQVSRAIDLEAMRAGAAGFLDKRGLDAVLLERSIRYGLGRKRHAEELERRVRERTAELARTNEALQAEIAERVRVEKALRETSRRKDQFLSTLAHELRNPLVPIRNALEIMRLSGDTPESVEANRSLIGRQVKQLVRLIDDLLDTARITLGTIRLKRENIEVARVVAMAEESARPFIDAAGHRLTVSLPDEPLIVNVDVVRMVQVLRNLLHNAAKYMDGEGRIWLMVEREGAEAVIRVKDTGYGIPPETLEEIFDLFTQLKPHHEQAPGGLGIGLSLVKTLTQLHGGNVVARSEGPGQGSEFIVRLPLVESSVTAGRAP